MIRKFRIDIIIITCFAYLASLWLSAAVIILYVVISKQNSELGQMLTSDNSIIETIVNVIFALLLSLINLIALIPIGIIYGFFSAFFFSIFERRTIFIFSLICSGVFLSIIVYVVGIMIPNKLADTISFFGIYQDMTNDTELWITPGIVGTTLIVYLYTRKQFPKNI